MKKLFLITLSLFWFLANQFAQDAQYVWAKGIGSTNYDLGQSVAVEHSSPIAGSQAAASAARESRTTTCQSFDIGASTVGLDSRSRARAGTP